MSDYDDFDDLADSADVGGFAEVLCPWCSEPGAIALEVEDQGEWVQDCEVCCRPWRVVRDSRGLRVERSD